jgi:TolB-like protein
MSGDKEQEYFSDGLAEEIINLLAQTPVLKVIARASAFAFRGKEQDLRAIAATLGVGAILEGSVHRSGDRVRVTAQLISAEDGTHLFSERYDSVMADVLTLQDEIAVAITGALRIKLSESPGLPSYSPNTAAYEAFLKARYHEAKVTPDSLKLARQYYERNISLDPGFALAHVGLAITTWSRRTGGRGTRPNGPCCSIRPCRKLTPCSV